MQNYYDDITVHGEITATKISGELSEQTRAPIDDSLDKLIERLQVAETDLKKAVALICELAEKYNNAIEVINNLSERLAALENNYDPTVIKGV